MGCGHVTRKADCELAMKNWNSEETRTDNRWVQVTMAEKTVVLEDELVTVALVAELVTVGLVVELVIVGLVAELVIAGLVSGQGNKLAGVNKPEGGLVIG